MLEFGEKVFSIELVVINEMQEAGIGQLELKYTEIVVLFFFSNWISSSLFTLKSNWVR